MREIASGEFLWSLKYPTTSGGVEINNDRFFCVQLTGMRGLTKGWRETVRVRRLLFTWSFWKGYCFFVRVYNQQFQTRWFPFYPLIGGLLSLNPLKGHLYSHSEKVTAWITRIESIFLFSYATLEPQQTNIWTHISTTRSETPTQIPWFVSKKQCKNPSNHRVGLRQPPSMLQMVTTSSTHLYLSACFCLLFPVINWKVSKILWKSNMQKSMISSWKPSGGHCYM